MYAWNPELRRPYESAWALLQRFLVLNRLSNVDFRRIFDTEGHIFSRTCTFEQPRSPFAKGFKTLFDVDEYEFKCLFCGYYGLNLFNSPAESLRFCPECMRIGYHSPLHQATALRCCPIHRVEIMACCPQCGDTIPYSMVSPAQSVLYMCSNRHPLIDIDDIQPLLQPLPHFYEVELDSFTRTTRTVADHPAARYFLFDGELHGYADRRAFWLFAKLTGADGRFLDLMYQGEYRRSVLGLPKRPCSEEPVDWLGDRNQKVYEDRMLLKARRWFEHIERVARAGESPVLTVGPLEIGPAKVDVWGTLRSQSTKRAVDHWRDYWVRTPHYLTPKNVGATVTVASPTLTRHQMRSAAHHHGVDRSKVSERIFLWAYRKMMASLFVATCQIAVKLGWQLGRLKTLGWWAFPRCYLWIDGKDVSFMVMDPDHHSPRYRQSIALHPEPAERAGGKEYLHLIGVASWEPADRQAWDQSRRAVQQATSTFMRNRNVRMPYDKALEDGVFR